ncbi:MAG: hypothetical protein WKG07_49345 [Hymenobacter sp.]
MIINGIFARPAATPISSAGGTSLNLDYPPTANVAFRIGRALPDGQKTLFFSTMTARARNYGNLTTSIALSF